MASEKLLTTKDLADALGVSESSLRRWTNSGTIKTARTAGGHRRIPLSEAIRFIRQTNAPMARPEILGLPALTPATGDVHDQEGLYEALRNGDESAARGQILSLYLRGMSIAELSDGPICSAMQRLGELWKHSSEGILIEHHATDICIQSVGHLRSLLDPPAGAAPLALGASPTGEAHALPSALAAAVLTEAGCRAVNFGAETPLTLLADAARERKPDLVWVSVTTVSDRYDIRTEVNRLARQLEGRPTRLVTGGRATDELKFHDIHGVNVLGSMVELSTFVKTSLHRN